MRLLFLVFVVLAGVVFLAHGQTTGSTTGTVDDHGCDKGTDCSSCTGISECIWCHSSGSCHWGDPSGLTITVPSDCSKWYWGQCNIAGDSLGTDLSYSILLSILVCIVVALLCLAFWLVRCICCGKD